MNKNTTTTTVKTPAANFTGDVWMTPSSTAMARPN